MTAEATDPAGLLYAGSDPSGARMVRESFARAGSHARLHIARDGNEALKLVRRACEFRGTPRRRWSLSVGEPFQPGGQCSWAAPAADSAGAALVLKVGFRFPGGEERDEAAGLQAWEGNGAVRLHAASDGEGGYGLLLERCLPGTPLGQLLPEPEQDVVVARLLGRLWAQPHPAHPFRPLTQVCAAWAQELEAGYAAARPDDRIDPGLARAGIELFRELPHTAASQVLLATDLHAGNILAACREPWLVIDPKPYVGDPAYDVLQHMLNCDGRLAADQSALPTGWPAWPDSTLAGYACGCSSAPCRSPPARRCCAR
jgi:streptomycin 6-kinase